MKKSASREISPAVAVAALMLGVSAAAFSQDDSAASASTSASAPGPVPAEMAPRAASAQINDLAVVGKRLVAVGDKGVVITSTDGKNWKQSSSPVDVLLTAVSFADEKRGWAVGHDASIIHTADGGESWTVQHWDAKDNRPFMDVIFLDAQRGFAVGAYGLFKVTQDGGGTWTDFADPAFEEGPHLNALNRTADGQLVLVGEKGLVATSPDGTRWTVHPSGYEGSLFSVIPRGEKGALIVGMRGTMFEVPDLSCPSLRKVQTATDKSLFGLVDLGGGKVAVGGNSGTVRELAPGSAPKALVPPPETGLTQSSTIGGLALWEGRLLAMTDRGVKILSGER